MTDEVDRLMAGIAERKVRDLARAITLSKQGTDGLELFGGLRNRPGLTLNARVATSSASPDHREWAIHDDGGADYGVPRPRSVGAVVAVDRRRRSRRCAAR